MEILGIIYGREERGNLIIKSYPDLDWLCDNAIKKPKSGFVFVLNEGLVSWCFKKQVIVALSLTKAEYLTLSLAAKEAT